MKLLHDDLSYVDLKQAIEENNICSSRLTLNTLIGKVK
jgi:hypothetical protein